VRFEICYSSELVIVVECQFDVLMAVLCMLY